MKTTCLLFLTISWTASMNAASGHPLDAESVAQAGRRYQAARKAPHEQRGTARVSGRNHPPSRASLTKANRPKQLPNSRLRSIPGQAVNLRQAGSAKSGDPAKDGLAQAVAVTGAPRPRPVSAVRSAVPSLSTVRHRGPNPAVVGGFAPLRRANTGAIDGTCMNRKP